MEIHMIILFKPFHDLVSYPILMQFMKIWFASITAITDYIKNKTIFFMIIILVYLGCYNKKT